MFEASALRRSLPAITLALVFFFGSRVSAQTVTLYDQPNFAGQSKGVGVGQYALSDFNAMAASIRVPAGVVAVLYEAADSGGGYGAWVDLLEDHADLSDVNFSHKAAYIMVFTATKQVGNASFVWIRNHLENGTFIPGHWERPRAGGGPVYTAAVVAPPAPAHAPGAQPFHGSGPVVRNHMASGTPAVVLSTSYKNPSFDTSKQSWPHWAYNAVDGKAMFPNFFDVTSIPVVRLFGSHDYVPTEWTQLLNPTEDYEVDIVGASGRAIIMPDGRDGISGGDVPFTHPFGTDWEFYIAPDEPYRQLAAPPAPPPNTHAEYASSVTIAKNEFGIDVVNTLGVEMELGLIPDEYRVRHGDRVAVWGRWIVDCGHPDFHTEIHPPLLLATGRATSSDETESTVIGRPYLTSQWWAGGPGNTLRLGMIDHLIEEANKVPQSSLRAEAHPTIMPNSFNGTFAMRYTVAPPSPRTDPADRLIVSYHFTVRTGIAVQVVNQGDSVSVVVAMNSNTYKRAPLPRKHDLVVDRAMLKKMDPRAGDLYIEKEVERGVVSAGIGTLLLSRGVLTDRYDHPTPRPIRSTEMIETPVTSLPGNTPVTVNDGQPFPIYGRLTLRWERAGTQ